MSDVRIGISGWRYTPWRGGTFYPRDLTQKRELEYASRQVRTIELNGSFYSLQRPSSYRAWYQQTPDDFLFSIKGSRYLTHMRRLKDIELPLANFLASGVLALEEKLGPILWQLPPSFSFKPERLAAFFDLLPRDTKSAARIAAKHDARVNGRAWFDVTKNRRLRHAIEVRHPSFETPAFIDLLRRHDIALVMADTAKKWPFMQDVTSDFVYIRLHGDVELYVSGYTDEALETWGAKIRQWSAGKNAREAVTFGSPAPIRAAGRDVYVYFDNDVKVRAPFDAMTLAYKLGLGPKPAEPPDPRTISEEPRKGAPAFPKPRKPLGRTTPAGLPLGPRASGVKDARWNFDEPRPARLRKKKPATKSRRLRRGAGP